MAGGIWLAYWRERKHNFPSPRSKIVLYISFFDKAHGGSSPTVAYLKGARLERRNGGWRRENPGFCLKHTPKTAIVPSGCQTCNPAEHRRVGCETIAPCLKRRSINSYLGNPRSSQFPNRARNSRHRQLRTICLSPIEPRPAGNTEALHARSRFPAP